MLEPALRQVVALAYGRSAWAVLQIGSRIEPLNIEMPEQKISRVLFPFD